MKIKTQRLTMTSFSVFVWLLAVKVPILKVEVHMRVLTIGLKTKKG